MASILEEGLLQQLQAAQLPEPVREYRFCSRRWRFDFAWRVQGVAVEVEGGVWARGRHNRGAGFEADLEKYNTAAIMGWLVLRYTERAIGDGTALREIALVLKDSGLWSTR